MHADAGARRRGAVDRLLDLALAWESPQGCAPLSGVAEGWRRRRRAGLSGLRPRSADPPTRRRGRARARRAVRRRPGRCSSTSPTTAARHRRHRPAHGAARGRRDARRGAARPPAAGAPRRRRRACCPARSGSPCAAGAPRASRSTTCPSWPTSGPRPGAWSTGPPPARRSRRCAASSCCSTSWGTAPAGRAAQRRPRRARPQGDRRCACTSTSRRPRWSSRSPPPPGCSPRGRPRRQPGLDAHRRLRRLDRPARRRALDRGRAGLAGQHPAARPGRHRATPPARPGTRSPPSSPRTGQVESRRMALDVLAELPDGPGAGHRHRAAVAGGPGRLAAPAPPAHPRRAGRLGGRARRRRWASPASTGSRRTPARCWPATTPPPTRPSTRCCPSPVDHVLIQADLTAVAPGPAGVRAGPHAAAARRRRVARRAPPSTASPRRRCAGRSTPAGRAARDPRVRRRRSRGPPVPQPLTYLVDDTARTFGTVRVGHAEAFLRADDEAALTELLHHPKAGALGLRRIAPTVLVSTTPLDVLLPAAARARRRPGGRVRRRHRPRRAPRPAARPPAPRRSRPARAAPRPTRARTWRRSSNAVRAGDRAAASRPADPERGAHAERLARRAARGRRGRRDRAHRLRRQPRLALASGSSTRAGSRAAG